jgi:enoyl-CoA hydratase/carnithine racemase
VVTLRRPDKLNALTTRMRRELAAIFRHFGPGDRVRGIVLTGAGRAFTAGLDLVEASEAVAGYGLAADLESFNDITRAALETTVPIVAAINGLAVGGGSEITLCFDARLGTPATEFFLPENTIGLSISNASSLLLPRLTGARALPLILNAARIDADEALSLGLLDQIVEPDELLGASIALIHRWTQPGAATAAHLRLLRPSLAAVENAFRRETEAAQQIDDAGLPEAGITKFRSRR